MIHFLDASALVKRYVAEPGSEVVRSLFRRRRRLAASVLSLVEVPAAMWRRARKGDLPRDAVRDQAARVARDLGEVILVQVRQPTIDLAAELVEKHPLRAYDALQLASALWLARETGLAVTFVCADARLRAAAAAEGARPLGAG